MPGTPEPSLLPAVAAGVNGATTDLWDRYADRVRNLGLRLSGHDAGFADDLVQETFLKLWRGARSFDATLGTEATFVFTVARRAAVDQWRRTRRFAAERPLDGPGHHAEGGSRHLAEPGDHVETVVTGWVVTEALESLGPAQREVVHLAYYGQLTQSEIAERLGVPLGTVKTRTFAAMKALRTALVARGVMQ